MRMVSALKMEAACSSEKSVSTYNTTHVKTKRPTIYVVRGVVEETSFDLSLWIAVLTDMYCTQDICVPYDYDDKQRLLS